MTGIEHQTICDHTTLGWTALQVEEKRGPDLCVTVSELRRAREVFRDAGQLPPCDCARIQVAGLGVLVDRARKSGDRVRYEALLAERRELASAWNREKEAQRA